MLLEHQTLICDFVFAIPDAIDLASPMLNSHHKKVAYISGCIAKEAGLPSDEVQDVVLASMLHDIGAFSIDERIEEHIDERIDERIGEYWGERKSSNRSRHALLGYELLRGFKPLAKAAYLIKHHHADHHSPDGDVPVGSSIIHLADRVALLIDEKKEIFSQVQEIVDTIGNIKNIDNSNAPHPETLEAIDRLSKLEYFWIEAALPPEHNDLMRIVPRLRESIDMGTLKDFARAFAQIIDFRSRFTAAHSSGVATVAKELAMLSGFSEQEQHMMEIAGLLHDVGKLAVPNEIIEKNGSLSASELNCVKKHAYYTYAIVSKIRCLEHIAPYAAHHHERLDGNGYPFHVKGRDFSKLSRIMAVSDMFSALMEDRPYRDRMKREQAATLLINLAKSGGIDQTIMELLLSNFQEVNDARLDAQHKAQKKYDSFCKAIANGESYHAGESYPAQSAPERQLSIKSLTNVNPRRKIYTFGLSRSQQ
ncbi:MAG: HD domain-containing protein [Peptococcaceae bacterium]|jgi:HD-GYP domain-containing protein (c-di-GMP phosphodiesterase class II)|nr:HD domain-containing protein [Peptococcaceae bacterium]